MILFQKSPISKRFWLAAIGAFVLLLLHWETIGGREEWQLFYKAALSVLQPLAHTLGFRDLAPTYSGVKQLVDLCSSLLALLYSLFLLKLTMPSQQAMSTPKNRLSFFLLLNMAWLAIIASTLYYFIYHFERYDYPSNGDSMGIPIIFSIFITLLSWPFVNGFCIVMLRTVMFPAVIFSRFPKYTDVSIAYEIVFGILLIGLSFFLLAFILSGDVTGIPIIIMLLYLVLSMRAGKIASRIVLKVNSQARDKDT